MPTWKGIVGRGFRAQEFKEYVATLSFSDWRPQFAVVHNTSSPRLSQWHSHPGEERMRNLESYYRDEQKWSGGPHLFIADDFIWVFTPLTTSGVHSPSWNSISWGMELVGEYDDEPFNPGVRENAVDALAILHAWSGISPDTLRFHKEDPATTHTHCPGKNVSKEDLIARIKDRMTGSNGGEHQPQDNYLEIGAGLSGGGQPAAAASPSSSGAVSPLLGTAKVQSPDGVLSIRSGPKASAKKLGELKNDDLVSIFERNGEWCRIAAGTEQWVARQYLAPVAAAVQAGGPAATAPSVDHQVAQVDTLYEVFYSDEAKKQLRRDVPLYKLTDRAGLFHKGSMQIDVDGSPRAYFPNDASPLKLDVVQNASSGSKTYIQGQGLGRGPRPNFYVSSTSLLFSGQQMWDCGNFLDAETIPFFVHPPSRNGVRPGDLGVIVHIPSLKTANPKWTAAIFGDCNDDRRVSEASLGVAVSLGRSAINPKTLAVTGLSANNGDDARNYFYLYFPGSAFAPEASAPHWPEDRIRSEAEPLFKAWGGLDMVKECLSHI